jgi:hypothetical protein
MMMRLLLVLFMVLWPQLAMAADAAPLVVFVHGRWENASGADWANDNPALDGDAEPFETPGPFGNVQYYGVPSGKDGAMLKRVRESYWMNIMDTPPLGPAVEQAVGRPSVLYVRYDAKDSFVYEPKSTAFVATQVRAWLASDASRRSTSRQIVWIAHSHGGLVTRYMMAHPEKYKDLIGRTSRVISIAAPQLGSPSADAEQDPNRVKNVSVVINDIDHDLSGAARLFGQKFSIFDGASKMLKPGLAKVAADALAQSKAAGGDWRANEKAVREAQSDYVAEAFENTMEGRIDLEMTTVVMQQMAALPASDPHALPLTSPVPVEWIAGNLYPMNIGDNPFDFIGKIGSWNDLDWEFFLVSQSVTDPRLVKMYPKDKSLQRNDAMVGLASATALGTPLGGDAKAATFPSHHVDLLFNPKVTSLILQSLTPP